MKRVLVLLLLLLLPVPSRAQWAVFDANGLLQMLTAYKNQLQQYAEQLRQTQQGYDQIKNQMDQIVQAKTQVEQGFTNLKRLDINNAGSLWSLGQQLTDKFRQAEMISYDAGRAWGQAQSVYAKVSGTMDARSLNQLNRRWALAQREAGQVNVTMQAIRQQETDWLAKNRDLLNRAATAKGNLDVNQAMAQLQGLNNAQLGSIEGQLVTQGRIQALNALEDASMKEATAAYLDQASATITLSAEPQGKLLPLSK